MQNILLLHNERLEAIESIPTSTVPSTDAAPQQQSSGIDPPGHPANHCGANIMQDDLTYADSIIIAFPSQMMCAVQLFPTQLFRNHIICLFFS